MVRVTGLEPALLSEAAPKTAVYANFTTPAYYSIFDFQPIGIIRKSTTVVTLPKSKVSARLAKQAVMSAAPEKLETALLLYHTYWILSRKKEFGIAPNSVFF